MPRTRISANLSVNHADPRRTRPRTLKNMSVDHAQPRKPRPRTLTDLGVDHAMGPVARVQAAGQMIEMQKKHLAGTKLEVRDVEEKDEADRIIAVIAQLRLTQRELAQFAANDSKAAQSSVWPNTCGTNMLGVR